MKLESQCMESKQRFQRLKVSFKSLKSLESEKEEKVMNVLMSVITEPCL